MKVVLNAKVSWWVAPLLRTAGIVLAPVALFMTEKQIDGLSEKFGELVFQHGMKLSVTEAE